MKFLVGLLVALLILLQYRVWLSDGGLREVVHLRAAVAAQEAENATLTERNLQLAAEVRDLRSGTAALEERARNDLGMVGRGETFYQVVPPGTPLSSRAGAPLPVRAPAVGAPVTLSVPQAAAP
jgi:cell division protein FtsB